jgi:hypothetical protein
LNKPSKKPAETGGKLARYATDTMKSLSCDTGRRVPVVGIPVSYRKGLRFKYLPEDSITLLTFPMVFLSSSTQMPS